MIKSWFSSLAAEQIPKTNENGGKVKSQNNYILKNDMDELKKKDFTCKWNG